MICDVSATLEEKTAAIQNRTPDQRMAREGVPVSIGGEVFEIRPLVRKHARELRETVRKWIADIDAAQTDSAADAMAVLDLTDDGYAAAVTLAIPELSGRGDWLDDNATSEELSEAFQLAMVFVNPNRAGAQTTNGTGTSVSPTSTPSSANSTPPTPLQPLTKSSQTSK